MAGRESTYFHPEPGLSMNGAIPPLPHSRNGVHREIVGSVQSLLGKEEEEEVVVVMVVVVVVVVVAALVVVIVMVMVIAVVVIVVVVVVVVVVFYYSISSSKSSISCPFIWNIGLCEASPADLTARLFFPFISLIGINFRSCG